MIKLQKELLSGIWYRLPTPIALWTSKGDKQSSILLATASSWNKLQLTADYWVLNVWLRWPMNFVFQKYRNDRQISCADFDVNLYNKAKVCLCMDFMQSRCFLHSQQIHEDFVIKYNLISWQRNAKYLSTGLYSQHSLQKVGISVNEFLSSLVA